MKEKIEKIYTDKAASEGWVSDFNDDAKAIILQLMEDAFEAGRDDAMEGHVCAENVIYP